MNLDSFGGWAKEQALDKLMLICEVVKVQAQRNVSKSTSALGPSLPGEFPHADTGYLRNSIFWDVNKNKMTGIVGTSVKYGLWLETGTDGGVLVTPKASRMLSWVDPRNGQRVFAHKVITKPMLPRSFLRRTLMESTDRIKKILNQPMPKPPSGTVAIG